jgi:hypothetical protein
MDRVMLPEVLVLSQTSAIRVCSAVGNDGAKMVNCFSMFEWWSEGFVRISMDRFAVR